MKSADRPGLLCGLSACLTLAAGCAPGDSGSGLGNSGSGLTGAETETASSATEGSDSGNAPPADDGAGSTGGDPDESTGAGSLADVDAYIIGLGTLQTPADALVEGDASEATRAGDYMCSTTDISQTQRFDQIVAFAANSGGLFPGAIIDGASVSDGTLVPRVLDRAPLTFSASLEGVADRVIPATVSATLEQPSLSAFRETMSELLDEHVVDDTPADVTYAMREVHSAEQLSLAVGLDVEWMSGDITGSLEFDHEERKGRILVDVTQAYYTINVDRPGRPSDLLAGSTSLQDVEDVLQDVPPAYVSSVTFGRRVFFAVTSDVSAKELRSALEFGFDPAAEDIAGSVSLTHSEVLEDSQITAFTIGADGSVASQAIHGSDGIRSALSSGGTYSPETPGAAIAYAFAHLADNSPARFALTSDYQTQECTRVSQNVRLTLQNLHVVNDGGDPGSELELYGFIDGFDQDWNIYQLMDRNLDEYVTVGLGQSWPQSGEIESRILPVVPQPGHHFTIGVALRERDVIASQDDSFGDHWFQIDYEDGWRDDSFVAHLAHGDQQVEVRLAFVPVP